MELDFTCSLQPLTNSCFHEYQPVVFSSSFTGLQLAFESTDIRS